MSMKRAATYTCPECGTECSFTMWESLNADLDPEAKETLIAGKLFDQECSNCHKHTNVIYPILYHDMEHKIMIQLIGEDDDIAEQVKQFKMAINSLNNQFKKKQDDNYQYRVVNDHNDLREKALIFNDGLDDKVIEVLKKAFLLKLKSEKPDINIKHAYYLPETDGKYGLEFISEEDCLQYVFNENLYNDIHNTMLKENPEKVLEKTFIVDETWAAAYIP